MWFTLHALQLSAAWATKSSIDRFDVNDRNNASYIYSETRFNLHVFTKTQLSTLTHMKGIVAKYVWGVVRCAFMLKTVPVYFDCLPRWVDTFDVNDRFLISAGVAALI